MAQKQNEKPKPGFKDNKNRGFKDRLQRKIEDAKRIDEDPSAFTEGPEKERDVTNHEDQILTQVNFMGGTPVPQNQMYYQQQMYGAPYGGQYQMYSAQDQLAALEYQKAQIYADLKDMSSKIKKVDIVAQKEGANRHYTCTDEYLNKNNPHYQGNFFPEQARVNRKADDVAQSVQKLNDLLQKKKENKPIPFVTNYTPQRKGKSKAKDQKSQLQDTTSILSNTMPNTANQYPTMNPMATFVHPQYYQMAPQWIPHQQMAYHPYPQQPQPNYPHPHNYPHPQRGHHHNHAIDHDAQADDCDGDSLDATNPMQEVSERSDDDDRDHAQANDGRGVTFDHHGLKREAEADGYLNKKKRLIEQRMAMDAKPVKKKDDNSVIKDVVVETEHGVLKVANKKHLTDLFS